jgi:hypothetical protein
MAGALGPRGIALPLEEGHRLSDKRSRVISFPGEPQYVRVREQCASSDLRRVRRVGDGTRLLCKLQAVASGSSAGEQSGAHGTPDHLGGGVLASGPLLAQGRQLLGFVVTSLGIDGFGQQGDHGRQPSHLADPLKLFVAGSELSLSRHRVAEREIGHAGHLGKGARQPHVQTHLLQQAPCLFKQTLRLGCIVEAGLEDSAALVGAQYYWIQHEHPIALMGYMAVLEGNPPTRASIDELISRTGYKEQAFRTLIAHAENDPEHMNDLEQTLDRLPCSPAQTALVGLSAMHTVVALTQVFKEIVRTGGEVHQQLLLADRS